MLKTFDGGESWEAVYGFFINLPLIYSCAFYSSSGGYVGSSEGRLSHTNDAGENWQIIHTGAQGIINGIAVYDSNVIATTYNGEIYRSDNLGVNWDTIRQYDEGGNFNRITFRDQEYGIIPFRKDSILFTNDFGRTWQSINLGFSIKWLHFPSPYTGYATANTKVYKVTYPRPLETGDLPDSVYYMLEGETLSVDVPFSVSAPFHGDNIFTAWLSSADGSWETPVQVGTLAGGQGSSINITLPAGLAPGACYKVRVDASSPPETGSQSSCFAIRNPADTCRMQITGLADTPFRVTNNKADTAYITFASNCTFGQDNEFIAWLANPTASIQGPLNIGTMTSIRAGTITGTMPAGIPTSPAYRIWITATHPVATSDTTTMFTIVNQTGLHPTHTQAPALYPVPAKEKLKVQSPYNIHGYTIYNNTGQQITKQRKHATKQLTIEVAGLPTGIYLLELQTAQATFRKKFTVQRAR
jgi:hypothetical protein